MLIVDEEQIKNIYNALKNITINSFEGTTIIDPAIDLGDKIIVDDKSIIFQGEMRFQTRFIADIKSTISIKAKEETTVRKTSQKVINRRVQSRIDEEDAKITLLAEQNTENEEKITQLELGLEGITTTVADNKEEINEALEETKTELETKIKVSAEGVESNVNKTLESYSTTEETNQSISNAKTEAINSTNDNIKNAIDESATTIQTNMSSQIQQTSENILDTVGETYTKKTELEQLEINTNTKFEQTKKDFLFQFNTITKSISDLSDATTEELNTISKYIRFVDGNIVLGETGNQLTLNISNDRISFLQGSQEVAYFSNNKLYITDGEFINSLKIGNFSFIPRTNGNLSFKKTGG